MPESPNTETRSAERAVSRAGTAREPDASTLVQLVQRIAAGEHDALGELYDVTVAKVFALARLILREEADAEEVVCDVYAQVWQTGARYHAERGTVMAWLLIMCRSRALDHARRNRVRLQTASHEQPLDDELPSAQPGPEDILDLMQQGTAVREALQKLTPIRRRLVSLAFFKGLSHLEIAAECSLPVGTVKSHIRRALVTLRAELAGGEADASST